MITSRIDMLPNADMDTHIRTTARLHRRRHYLAPTIQPIMILTRFEVHCDSSSATGAKKDNQSGKHAISPWKTHYSLISRIYLSKKGLDFLKSWSKVLNGAKKRQFPCPCSRCRFGETCIWRCQIRYEIRLSHLANSDIQSSMRFYLPREWIFSPYAFRFLLYP